MNKLKILLRKIIFIITVAYTLLLGMSIDSVYDNGLFFYSIIILIILGILCIKLKTNKLFNKHETN